MTKPETPDSDFVTHSMTTLLFEGVALYSEKINSANATETKKSKIIDIEQVNFINLNFEVMGYSNLNFLQCKASNFLLC